MNTSKISRLQLLLGVLLVAVVLVPAAAAKATAHWPKPAEKSFVQGCVKNGGNASLCTCALAHVEKTLSYKQLIASTQSASAKRAAEAKTIKAAKACIHH